MSRNVIKLDQKGAAVVLVLWALTLLSIIAVTYTLAVRNEMMLVNNAIHGSKARALAEAGVWSAVEFLSNAEQADLYADGVPINIMIDESIVRISLEDETGRIDLNISDEALLKGMLETTTVPRQIQHKIVNQILDWRDRDSKTRKQGAERSDYIALGMEYVPKNGSFNTIEELKQIPSMTTDLYDELEPLLTIHSQEEGVNYRTANRQVLRAIPGVTDDQADWIYRNRRSKTVHIFELVSDEARRYLFSKSNSVYRITSEARSKDVTSRIRAIVKLGAQKSYFSVLDWRES